MEGDIVITISKWYDRYQQGFCQEVYDELVAMQEQVFDDVVRDDAFLVAREMMRRVRYNLDMLLPRLYAIDYQFGKGFLGARTPEEQAVNEQHVPLYRPPGSQVHEQINQIEHLIGSFPISLRCWYELVGGINVVGMFALPGSPSELRSYGIILDPLLIMPLESLIEMVTGMIAAELWHLNPILNLSPDSCHKYGVSGSGGYGMKIPCKAFDAPFITESYTMNFIEYLRLCFRWGGFPGLARENRLAPDTLLFLTQDLLVF